MTNRRALELLMIENACVRRASGLEQVRVYSEDGCAMTNIWVQNSEPCNRDCANCDLVQKSEELLEMYSFVIKRMIEETEKEEEDRTKDWKDWQRNCDPRTDLVI